MGWKDALLLYLGQYGTQINWLLRISPPAFFFAGPICIGFISLIIRKVYLLSEANTLIIILMKPMLANLWNL